jgi:hypothetical protein
VAAFGGGFAYPLSCCTNLHEPVRYTESGAITERSASPCATVGRNRNRRRGRLLVYLRGDAAGWARAAENNRALIKIDLASIVSTAAPHLFDALPSHARCWIMIRDGDTSIVGNRELFHFSSSRFRMSARRQGCPTGERPPAAEHQGTAELRRGDRQVSRALVVTHAA